MIKMKFGIEIMVFKYVVLVFLEVIYDCFIDLILWLGVYFLFICNVV